MFDYTTWPKKAGNLELLAGQSGVLTLFQLSINGSDEQDHFIISAISDTGENIPETTSRRFFDLPVKEMSPALTQSKPDATQKDFEKKKQMILSELAERQSRWFDDEIEKLNFWADDKRKGLKTTLKDYDDQISILKKEARLAPNLPDKLAIQKRLRDMDKKRDTAWREYDEAAKQIETQKDELLDTVEERLRQTVEEKTIFTIRWSIV